MYLKCLFMVLPRLPTVYRSEVWTFTRCSEWSRIWTPCTASVFCCFRKSTISWISRSAPTKFTKFKPWSPHNYMSWLAATSYKCISCEVGHNLQLEWRISHKFILSSYIGNIPWRSLLHVQNIFDSFMRDRPSWCMSSICQRFHIVGGHQLMWHITREYVICWLSRQFTERVKREEMLLCASSEQN